MTAPPLSAVAPSPRSDAPPSEEPYALLERRGPIAELILNRPKKRNCLSEAMLEALDRRLASLDADPSVSVIVIAARGPVFSAGHDLKEIAAHRGDRDRGRAFFEHILKRCAGVMTRIVAMSKPAIAKIHGTATAAGCQLVASCDLAVASDESRFATPGVNIGLFCSTPMVALSRNVGRKQAMEMLLLGDAVDAETACRFGLVNRVVAAADLDDAVAAMARQIADKSPQIVGIGKKAFYKQAEMSLEDAYRYASETMAHNMMLRDADEGTQAFIEKRKPVWADKPGEN